MATEMQFWFREITAEEGQRVIARARDWIGVPYRWKGKDRRGADCSGAVWKIYEEAGLNFEYARTIDMPKSPFFIKITEPRAGDLIHWPPDEQTPYHGHVAIYDPDAGPGANSWSTFDADHPFGTRDYLKRRGTPTFWRVLLLEAK